MTIGEILLTASSSTTVNLPRCTLECPLENQLICRPSGAAFARSWAISTFPNFTFAVRS